MDGRVVGVGAVLWAAVDLGCSRLDEEDGWGHRVGQDGT